MTYDVVVDNKTHQVELTRREKAWLCKVDGQEIEVDAELTTRDVLSVLVGGKAYEIKRERSLQGELHMVIGSARYAVDVQDPRSLKARRAIAGIEAGPQKIKAPMPGKIVRVLVREEADVEAGQGIVVVEAMKMQNEIKSPKKGVVRKMVATEGANVNAGDVLAVVE